MKFLCAVGSRSDQVCSVGSFVRQEVNALNRFGHEAILLEPNQNYSYPSLDKLSSDFDVIIFHTPSLNERIRPWNFFKNFILIHKKYPNAKMLSVVHEFSEAPAHWKFRQIILNKLSDGVIVNSEADFNGVNRWSSKILRTRLAPTLFFEELLNTTEGALGEKIKKTRLELIEKKPELKKIVEKKWVLHPGLLTPGKGVNQLSKLSTLLPKDTALIVMGGIGPKNRDQVFASQILKQLESLYQDRFVSFLNADDDTFKKFLLAASLVVLPYDNGVSERRSSFLSAASCGANTWLTVGPLSENLKIPQSGSHYVKKEAWNNEEPEALQSILNAIGESESKQLERRMKNLEWSKEMGWKKRVQDLESFIRE